MAALRRVTKRFPGIVALNEVSLTFYPGEIHVLLGENGAGKSTLVSLLAGMQQPDEGEILIGGRPAVVDSPRRSMDLGIGTVFQRVLLVPSLTVIENLMLGGSWLHRLARGQALRRFDELSTLLGTGIDPNAPVSGLSLGEQQQVEIMRALWHDEKLLLLDEPTSMLTPQGVADLGRMMQRLKAQGVALILITHKLLEAYEFGDRISVLRLGRVAGAIEPQRFKVMNEAERTRIGDLDDVRLQRRRRGRRGRGARRWTRVGARYSPRTKIAPGEYIGSQQGTHAVGASGGDRRGLLRNAAARRELRSVVGRGARDRRCGRQWSEASRRDACGSTFSAQRAGRAAGSDITRGRVPERRQRGIRYVTDDRLGEGTVGTFSVATNLVLKEIGASPYWRHGISDWNAIHRGAREQIQRNDIRTPSELTPVGKLSGGNVQKVLLARELDAEANVAVLNKPTYGLDLHNQRLALDRIVAAAARGVALIVISTDLDELLEISDRVGVMFQGRLSGIVQNDDGAASKVRRLMTGADAA